MKAFRLFALISLCTLSLAQQGPSSKGSETVARPRRPGASAPAPEPDQPKIPSQFPKKDGELPQGVPTFTADVLTVSVDGKPC